MAAPARRLRPASAAFSRSLAKFAGVVLGALMGAAGMAGARCFLAIIGEVARIAFPLFAMTSSSLVLCSGRRRRPAATATRLSSEGCEGTVILTRRHRFGYQYHGPNSLRYGLRPRLAARRQFRAPKCNIGRLYFQNRSIKIIHTGRGKQSMPLWAFHPSGLPSVGLPILEAGATRRSGFAGRAGAQSKCGSRHEPHAQPSSPRRAASIVVPPPPPAGRSRGRHPRRRRLRSPAAPHPRPRRRRSNRSPARPGTPGGSHAPAASHAARSASCGRSRRRRNSCRCRGGSPSAPPARSAPGRAPGCSAASAVPCTPCSGHSTCSP